MILDGKIYLVEGLDEWTNGLDGWTKVHKFDVVGQRGWQICADMYTSRQGGKFACSVKDGKIYAYGSGPRRSPSCGSQFYDPEENAWTQIGPLPFWEYGDEVATLGEELPVFRGKICDRDHDTDESDDESDDDYELPGLAVSLEDEWRVVQPAPKPCTEAVFTARGKLYWLTAFGIDIYSDDENTWSHRHSNSFAALGPSIWSVEVLNTLAFNTELLLAVRWRSEVMEESVICLLQSTGFGTDTEEIVWQKVDFPVPLVALIGEIQL